MAKKEKEVVKEVEMKTPKVEVTKVEEVKSEQNVKVKPAQDINCYIGDQFYRLKKGVIVSVPRNVKEILQKAGMLDVI